MDNIDDVEVDFERNDEVVRVEITLEIDSTKNIISSQYPATAIA